MFNCHENIMQLKVFSQKWINKKNWWKLCSAWQTEVLIYRAIIWDCIYLCDADEGRNIRHYVSVGEHRSFRVSCEKPNKKRCVHHGTQFTCGLKFSFKLILQSRIWSATRDIYISALVDTFIQRHYTALKPNVHWYQFMHFLIIVPMIFVLLGPRMK